MKDRIATTGPVGAYGNEASVSAAWPHGDRSMLATVMVFLAALMLLLVARPVQAQEAAYVLGPGDGLAVQVFGQDEFNLQTKVKADGTIVMPLIGKVQASGRTILTLADDITRQLEQGKFLQDPIVNVEITQYNSKYARVVGKVGTPMMLPLDRPYHVLDVLLRAGWVRENGSRYVLLHREGQEEPIRLDTDLLARAGPGSDVMVQPGDTLFVEAAEVVYLTGQVARPGAYQLEPGMTIAKLIAIAGGVGPTGSSKTFGVRRDEGKEQKVDDQFVLQKDDVVDVKERFF